MAKSKNLKMIIGILCAGAFLVLALCIKQFITLRKAHSTFANYYAFRGCVQLLSKTDTYGTCKTSSGQVIKIVEINGKWYLDGDGPGIW